MKTVVYNVTPALAQQWQREQLPAETDVVFATDDTEAAVADQASSATILVTGPNAPVTRDVLDRAAPAVPQAVLQASTGIDNINLDAAADYDVPVANIPDYCTEEVATHAIGLLLAARRRIPAHDRDVRTGTWDWQPDRPMPRFAGSTLGIVSFGRIARTVVSLTKGFDLDYLVYDPYVDDETIEAHGGTPVSFGRLLRAADAVTIHAPLTPETRGLFDTEAFETLPDHAVLVNVGRGGIVDETALATALDNDELAAAALDVLEQEPPGENTLLKRDDVIVTPHSAWYSEDAQRVRNETIATNVRRVLNGEQPEHVIEPDGDW